MLSLACKDLQQKEKKKKGVWVMAKCQLNVRLQKAIADHFGTTAKLCRIWPGCKGKATKIASFVHCGESPLLADGSYCPVASALSEALGILPEKLFPAKLYEHVLPRRVKVVRVRYLSAKEARRLRDLSTVSNTFECSSQSMLRTRIFALLKTLDYREREIIKLRYGLGDGYCLTCEEVGHIFKVTYERVRQIEAKAVRKLQQPHRSELLVGFLD